MEDNNKPSPKVDANPKQSGEERQHVEDGEQKENESKISEAVASTPRSGGWGGWGFSPLSLLSDLQKAAEEISRNAAVVTETATKSLLSTENTTEDSVLKEEGTEVSATDSDIDVEDEKMRKLALDKLEKASEDSIFGQGLKVIDNSVENFTSGAWQALGSAWRGGTDFVRKLEHSATNIAESLQNGGAGSVAPSLLETGRAFTTKGIQVLENVGKETMDLLINETGIEVEKGAAKSEGQTDEDQLSEEVTFDRFFYIYGGPEQLEELEALSSHYALLYNRRKAKLSPDQKSTYDAKLKEIQQIFDLSIDVDGSLDVDKGKKVGMEPNIRSDEMKNLHDTSVSKAADMAAGFTSALTGQAMNDIIQRTAGRLESIHSEGVHRLSEMCCFAVSQLQTFGKSVISHINEAQREDAGDDTVNIDWPEDSVGKAKIIRTIAQLMTGYVEAVSVSFITGISDVAEAYEAAIKGATADSHQVHRENLIQDKANAFTTQLRSDQRTAVGKIQDGLQYLSYVVLSTSMSST